MVKYITSDKSNSVNLTSVPAYILISIGQINTRVGILILATPL